MIQEDFANVLMIVMNNQVETYRSIVGYPALHSEAGPSHESWIHGKSSRIT
jgi:hypothetical protein